MVFNPVLFTSLLISWLLIHLSFRNSGSNVTTLCQEKNMKGMELQLGFGVSQWILWDIKCFTERNAETRRMDRSTGMFFPNLWVDRLFLYLLPLKTRMISWPADDIWFPRHWSLVQPVFFSCSTVIMQFPNHNHASDQCFINIESKTMSWPKNL